MAIGISSLPGLALYFVLIILFFFFAEKGASWIYRNSVFPFKTWVSEESYVKIYHYGKYLLLIGSIVILVYFIIS